MIFGLQRCKSKRIKNNNYHLSKICVVHQLGLRVGLEMCGTMKMIHVYGGKCEGEIRSGDRQREG